MKKIRLTRDDVLKVVILKAQVFGQMADIVLESQKLEMAEALKDLPHREEILASSIDNQNPEASILRLPERIAALLEKANLDNTPVVDPLTNIPMSQESFMGICLLTASELVRLFGLGHVLTGLYIYTSMLGSSEVEKYSNVSLTE